jgi:hypothetical protein
MSTLRDVSHHFHTRGTLVRARWQHTTCGTLDTYFFLVCSVYCSVSTTYIDRRILQVQVSFLHIYAIKMPATPFRGTGGRLTNRLQWVVIHTILCAEQCITYIITLEPKRLAPDAGSLGILKYRTGGCAGTLTISYSIQIATTNTVVVWL